MKGFPPGLRLCTVEGCDRELRARGYCSMHWDRWRKYGSSDLPVRPQYETCQAEGCPDAPRSKYAEHCETHYYRLRRTGSLEDPKRISGVCVIDGCARDAMVSGRSLGNASDVFCRLHYLRLKRRGDAHFEFKGENNNRWTGDAATNKAVHLRVRKVNCSSFANAAADWCGPATSRTNAFLALTQPNGLGSGRYRERCPVPERCGGGWGDSPWAGEWVCGCDNESQEDE